MRNNSDFLTDDEWREMFDGPEWSDDVVEAMKESPRAAYHLHKSRGSPEMTVTQPTPAEYVKGEAP